MINNWAKSRKAISPILATLLLVVIAVAAIVVTYAWIMTYMSNAARQAGVQLYKANVSFLSGSKIDIDIGNSGTSDTQIIGVYFGTSASSLQNQTITQGYPLMLPAGSVETATISANWNASETYYFKVLSSSGQTLPPWNEIAPSS